MSDMTNKEKISIDNNFFYHEKAEYKPDKPEDKYTPISFTSCNYINTEVNHDLHKLIKANHDLAVYIVSTTIST
jgi:hypothetical protein